jgi:Lipocalin-like domain
MKPLRILFLFLFCLSIPAHPQQNDVANKLLGAWRLVSVEGISPVRLIPYDHPTGLIIYDRSGWMSVQIAIKGDRKPFAKGLGSGTTEEKADAFDSYFSYYGPYTIDPKAQTITHHLKGYSYPTNAEINNVRWYEFQGNDRLILIPSEDGKGGMIDRSHATYKLIWERIKE